MFFQESKAKKAIALLTTICLILSSCAQQKYDKLVKDKAEYFAQLQQDLPLQDKIEENCGKLEESKRSAAIDDISCRNEVLKDYLSQKKYPYPDIKETYLNCSSTLAEKYSHRGINKKKFLKEIIGCDTSFIADTRTKIRDELSAAEQDVQNAQKTNKAIATGIAVIAVIGAVVWAASKGAGGGGGYNNDLQGCCSYHQGINMCYAGRVVCNDGQYSPTCTCN